MKKKTSAPSELTLDLMMLLYEQPRGSGDLSDAVEDLLGRSISMATFFRKLQKAVDQGWVEIDEPADTSTPGRPGRLYHLSPEGERLLRSGIELHRRRVSRAEELGLVSGDGR